ncbi:MAG: sensor histidine kinase [Velocimicrobium sp.]
MVMKKRLVSLKVIFLEYLFTMVAMLILAVVIPYTFFSIGMRAGFYTYANSSEVQAKNMESKISAAKPFDRKLIPASCTYVYLSKDYTVLQSNMKKEEVNHAISYVKGNYRPATLNDCYLSIKREDGICILHYYIGSRYRVDWMEEYLPNIDKLLIFFCIVNAIAGCFIVTTLFAKRLKKQLQPLMEATQKIKEQDLDFETRSSEIQEFNHILLSMSDMKFELKHSLEQQWRMEQEKKEQTSALAHDIKTPITIIRGNAELLRDSKLTDKQQEYTNYILRNADRMEQYLKILIDLTRAEVGYSLQLEHVNLRMFLDELYSQINALALVKQLKTEFGEKELPDSINLDISLMQRAIINIISNAVDYSPKNGMICFYASASKDKIRFTITDSGEGFSTDDLKNAAKQFYQGDFSRSSKLHYGMGLFIADSIVKQHGGEILIANSPITGGGMITIEV